MSFFDKFKSQTEKFNEEALYAAVLKEMESGIRRDGLWAKALSRSDFNNDRAKAIYIELRVQSVKDENEFIRTAIEKEQVNSEKIHRENVKKTELTEEEKYIQKVTKDNPPIFRFLGIAGPLWMLATYFLMFHTGAGSSPSFYIYWFLGSIITLALIAGLL